MTLVPDRGVVAERSRASRTGIAPSDPSDSWGAWRAAESGQSPPGEQLSRIVLATGAMSMADDGRG